MIVTQYREFLQRQRKKDSDITIAVIAVVVAAKGEMMFLSKANGRIVLSLSFEHDFVQVIVKRPGMGSPKQTGSHPSSSMMPVHDEISYPTDAWPRLGRHI
jgi:hypothetical protein